MLVYLTKLDHNIKDKVFNPIFLSALSISLRSTLNFEVI